MSSTLLITRDFLPLESLVALAFIGAVIVLGLIGRCLASNNATMRSGQNLDLMIYQAAPRPVQAAKAKRVSLDQSSNANGQTQDSMTTVVEPEQVVRIQRGPKNL
jgi:hypothetical protein